MFNHANSSKLTVVKGTSLNTHEMQLNLLCQSLGSQIRKQPSHQTILSVAYDHAIKKPVGRSLNPAHKIKPLILEMIFKKTGRTPAQLYPKPGELHEYLTGPMRIQDRKIWYLSKSKYRNNFEIRNNYERHPSRK